MSGNDLCTSTYSGGPRDGRRMNNQQRRTRRLATQSGWGLVGEVVLVGGGLVNFVVLTQLLSKGDYGLVASVQGIAAPAYALASMGAPFLLMRGIARTNELQRAWTDAITSVGIGSIVVTALLALFQPVLLRPAAWLPFVVLLVSTGALVVYQELFFFVAMGLERIQLGVLARSIGTACRLASLAAFALVAEHSFAVWASYIVVGNVVAGLIMTLIVGRQIGVQTRLTTPTVWLRTAKRGYGFAMNGISEGVLDASDRPILASTTSVTTAGEYGAAARLVTFSFIPVMGIMRAISAELLRAGVSGVSGPLRVTRRVLPLVMVVGLSVAAITWVSSPLLPILIGEKWRPSVEILRWLAFVPAIKAVQFLAGNALDAGQRQFVRFWLTMGAAGLNLILNLIFIPRYSWKAAVVTTIGAEGLLMIALWVALIMLSRSERLRSSVASRDVNPASAASIGSD